MYYDVEILAPVGSFESLAAAIQAKANAIYLGVKELNMRTHGASNFDLEEVKQIVNICKKNNIKCYLTLNSVIYDPDLPRVKEICGICKKIGIDAVIASDLAVIAHARSIDLSVHISTQANISNTLSAIFFANFADTIILARELTLEQIKSICTFIKENNVKGPNGNLLKVELFVHGALCVAISGKCYMSLAQYNKSANRGECLQVCRRKYRVFDEESGSELQIDNNYVLSPSDLCTISYLDKILESGVTLLKIEGRGRSADYVFAAVTAYREAIGSIKNKSYTKEKITAWKEALKKVYNRGFWEGGYYLGKKISEWSASYGSKAICKKVFVGKVTNYFSKLNVAEVKLESEVLKNGDNIIVIGETTGVVTAKVTIPANQKIALQAFITFSVPQKVRRNDKVYLQCPS